MCGLNEKSDSEIISESDLLENQIVKIPINGVLDLHTFQPREVKPLVLDYLEECSIAGIKSVRIIHGKGIGNLRRTVEAILSKASIVESWSPAPAEAGHWGATIAYIKVK